ncbi:TolC family outer membrane protein [Stutzerimonas kirkiae]|uniref:Channel protein TolC n=1 Tax=Stutzerimonas kirkiae TaxID=2211392 RepID=A0A4Q9R530_9GAMM|nr:channel protein TolC [Stutzerimonas kirkiae]TBV00712.1 channel protein TolC [Stutzerimonas kirkiae]TBV02693.1 channel protein TolC [Stutzerimonas kirkiae]TBV12804.1 channel protein TolC [Stutzerimonas kirkiae]
MKFQRSLAAASIMLAMSGVTSAEDLPNAIQQALNYHPEVSRSINSRHVAEKELRAVKGGYLPSVTLSAGTGREGTDSPSTRSGGSHWRNLHRSEGSINLNQMIFDGFATPNEVGRMKATVNSRAWSVLGTSENTALRAVEVYLDVLQRQEFVHLASENLRSHERIFDQIRLRTERGVGRLADLDQAEARLAQARNNLLTEETNLTDAKTNYFSVTGTLPEALATPTPLAGRLPASLEDARKIMIATNPLLKSAEADIEATERQYATSKSTYYPRFDAQLSRAADNNIDGTEGHVNEWQAMVRMNYTLFQGGSNKATREARAYQVNEALDVRNNALRQLNEELTLGYSALDNARRQLPIAKDYADRSLKVRDAYQQQFALGERTLLDLLDSENELFTAQRRHTEVKYIELFTQYRILGTTGELLKSQSVVAPMASTVLSDSKTRIDLPGLN